VEKACNTPVPPAVPTSDDVSAAGALHKVSAHSDGNRHPWARFFPDLHTIARAAHGPTIAVARCMADESWQHDPRGLEELFRALLLRRQLLPQPDRRGGRDRRRNARGGRRQADTPTDTEHSHDQRGRELANGGRHGSDANPATERGLRLVARCASYDFMTMVRDAGWKVAAAEDDERQLLQQADITVAAQARSSRTNAMVRTA
jgi:hypothetical protein